MDFADKIKSIAANIEKNGEQLKTEEATKHSLVMPFIQALGYNVFDISEVEPEYTADIQTKNGEKIDYAIKKDGMPIMLFECKKLSEKPAKHKGQLERYFHTKNQTRFGVLTNGRKYLFYSDTQKPNVMDDHPFYEIDLCKCKDSELNELKKFTKDNFNTNTNTKIAAHYMYQSLIKKAFNKLLDEPTHDFSKLLVTDLLNGSRFTTRFYEEIKPVIKKSLKSVIDDKVSDFIDRINNEQQKEEAEEYDIISNDNGINTTEEEKEGFAIIKAIACSEITADRISYRDQKSFFSVLVDNSIRKTACKLYFERKNKYLTIGQDNTKLEIGKIEDLYKYQNEIRSKVKELS